MEKILRFSLSRPSIRFTCLKGACFKTSKARGCTHQGTVLHTAHATQHSNGLEFPAHCTGSIGLYCGSRSESSPLSLVKLTTLLLLIHHKKHNTNIRHSLPTAKGAQNYCGWEHKYSSITEPGPWGSHASKPSAKKIRYHHKPQQGENSWTGQCARTRTCTHTEPIVIIP